VATTPTRQAALVTGASRKQGIAAAVALRLAEAGWDVATTCWRKYDETKPWASSPTEADEVLDAVRALGRRATLVEADLADPTAPARIFDTAEPEVGPIGALINAHCHDSMRGGVLDTSIDEFDRHMAVNALAVMLLIREFAIRFRAEPGSGRVVNLTSDALHGQLAYGASKAAQDRITVAAAAELGTRGITVNAINPGPTDTGWMSEQQMGGLSARTPLGRPGRPADAAELVAFLCSPAAGWITGQILYSNGGFRTGA
jgi:3-oxoacyl-[acyl-carrier protein] reductase